MVALESILLKIIQLFFQFLLLQLSFVILNPDVFLDLNVILFFVSIITIFTFVAQERIWSNDYCCFFHYLILISILSTVVSAFSGLGFPSSIACAFFCISRSFERLSFNIAITKKRVRFSYIMSICFIVIEILIFIIFKYFVTDNQFYSRFIFPSIGCFVFGVLMLFVSIGKEGLGEISFPTTKFLREIKLLFRHMMDNDGFFVIGTIFFVVMVTLIDRYAISLANIDNLSGSAYLYVLSIFGAIFSVVTALIDAYRPSIYIDIRENALKFTAFLRSRIVLKSIVIFIFFFIFSYFVVYVLELLALTGQRLSSMRGLWSIVLFSYFILSVASVFQIYFYAIGARISLFFIWFFAAAIKTILLMFFATSVSTFVWIFFFSANTVLFAMFFVGLKTSKT